MLKMVSATQFKAKCLAMLDEVGQTGDTITVTKRGRPVATLGPVNAPVRRSSEGILKGKVHIPDELLMADMSDSWEVLREKS